MKQYHDPIFGPLLEASFRKIEREEREEKAMRRAAKIDNTAKALVAYLRSKGVVYWPINGCIDGLAWIGGRVAVIDWKSPGGTLTDAQGKMVAQGCKIWFLSTTEQVDQMVTEMSR